MSDAGTPSDPNQPGWASPTPPPPPPGPEPSAPPAPPAPPTAPVADAPGDSGWNPPPAPVKRRRLTWLWILIPVLALFLVSLVLVGVFAWRLASPVSATNDYLALLRDRRFATAYGQRCDAFRAAVALNEFARGSEALPAIRHYDIDDVDPGWNDATTRGTVELSDRVIDVTVELEREDGDWRICAVNPIDRVFASGLSP